MSRHDTACREVLALLRLAEQGETGVPEALEALGAVFLEEVTQDGTRFHEDAEAEWGRILYGQRGHDLIASSPSPPSLQDILGKPPVTLVIGHKPEHTEDVLVYPAAASALHYHLDAEDFDLFDRVLMNTEEQGSPEAQTSWGPVNLTSILDGDLDPIEPSILHRDDGKALLYAGHVNALVGESESGKSWIALMACVEEMRGGRNVVFLDFEDSPRNVVARLLALGLDTETVRRHFDYIGPDTTMGPAEKDELFNLLDAKEPSLIILDGVNAAMSLLGLDLEKNKEVTQFYQWLLKPLANTRATVITVDHVTKNKDARGLYAIGAQAKRAMVDGAMLGVSTVDRFGRGRIGKLDIEVLKDRNGGVLALSEKRGDSKREYIASAIIDAREEGKVKMRLVFDSSDTDNAADPAVKLKLAVWKYLNGVAKPESAAKINTAVQGQWKNTHSALRELVDDGQVQEHEGNPRAAGDPIMRYSIVRNHAVNDLLDG